MNKDLMTFLVFLDGSVEAAGVNGGHFHSRVGHSIIFIIIIFILTLAGKINDMCKGTIKE